MPKKNAIRLEYTEDRSDDIPVLNIKIKTLVTEQEQNFQKAIASNRNDEVNVTLKELIK